MDGGDEREEGQYGEVPATGVGLEGLEWCWRVGLGRIERTRWIGLEDGTGFQNLDICWRVSGGLRTGFLPPEREDWASLCSYSRTMTSRRLRSHANPPTHCSFSLLLHSLFHTACEARRANVSFRLHGSNGWGMASTESIIRRQDNIMYH